MAERVSHYCLQCQIHPSCYVVLVEDQGVEVSERSGDNNAGCVRGGGRGVVQVAEHRPVGSGQCTRVHHHNRQQVNHPSSGCQGEKSPVAIRRGSEALRSGETVKSNLETPGFYRDFTGELE